MNQSQTNLKWILFSAMVLLLVTPVARAQWPGFQNVSTLWNTSPYSFNGDPAPSGAVTSNMNYYDGAMGDFDGDGLPDRGLNSRYGMVHNQGDGEFLPAIYQFQAVNLTPQHSGNSNSSYWGIELDGSNWLDIDNDNQPDYVSGGNGTYEGIRVLHNRKLLFHHTKYQGHQGFRILSTDVNGDGFVDFATTASTLADLADGVTRLFVNDGLGNFTEQAASRGLQPDIDFGDMVSGDINGDGDFDIIAAKARTATGTSGNRGRLFVFNNNGSGTFTVGQTLGNGVPDLNTFEQAMNLGDIDDDGDLDLVFAPGSNSPNQNTSSKRHFVFINDGAGSFTDESTTRMPTFSEANCGAAKLTDIDYDGDLDFISFHKAYNSNAAGNLNVYLNSGSGVFTKSSTHSVAFSGSGGTAVGNDLDVADLDGDGTYDLWVGRAGNTVQILKNLYQAADGFPANMPRNAQLVSENSSGVTISWNHPAYAEVTRKYKVYRSTSPNLARGDRELIKVVAKSRHGNESFSSPITRHTTTAYLNNTGVTLDGPNNKVTFNDTTALPGVRYYYSVAHVGVDNTESEFSAEVSGMRTAPGGGDTTAPYLKILHPTVHDWTCNPRIVLHYGDGGSGINLASLNVRFNVELEDGTLANTNLATAMFSRKDGGCYVSAVLPSKRLPVGPVTLTASIADVNGNVSTQNVTFTVVRENTAVPTARFTVPSVTGLAPLSLNFDASTSTGGSDSRVIEWRWNWSDNTSDDRGRRLNKTFEQAGTYPVRLLARNRYGAYSDRLLEVTALDSMTTGPATLAYEGFSSAHYPSAHQSLTALNPSVSGFTGNWTGGGMYTRPATHNSSPTPTYSAGGATLQTTGTLKAGESSRVLRNFELSGTGPFGRAGLLAGNETADIGVEGKTLYFSFLLQVNSPSDFHALELYRDGTFSGNRELYLGRQVADSTTNFVINTKGGTMQTLGTLNTGVNLFVVKIEFGAGSTAGNERITVWQNPGNLGTEGSNTPTRTLTNVANFYFDRVAFASYGTSNQTYYDELRFGTSWASVLPRTTDAPLGAHNLAAAPLGGASIRLTWTDSSSNETGFEVQQATSGSGPWNTLATTPADATSYDATGLASSTTHYFRVRAINTSGQSAYTSTASASTEAAATPPTAPTGLTVGSPTPSSLGLSWTDTSNDETGFEVERATSGSGPWTTITTTGANSTGYLATGLAASSTYYFRVRAINGNGASTWSNTANGTTSVAPTPPAAPSSLATGAVTISTIAVSWTDNSSNETSFELEQAPSASGPWNPIATPGANSTSYVASGLDAGTAYHLRVRAVNSTGSSAWSNTATATTLAPISSQLYAYEGFSDTHYSTINAYLTTFTAPVFGFSGNWLEGTGGAGFRVRAGNYDNGATLSYSDGVRTLHGTGTVKAGDLNRTGRVLDVSGGGTFASAGLVDGTNRIGVDGQTLYFSFLMHPRGANSYGALELHHTDSTVDANRQLWVGRTASSNAGNFVINAKNQVGLLGTYTTEAVQLFVVKIEFGAGTTAGNERITVYHNPTNLAEEGTNTAVTLTNVPNFNFDRASMASFNNSPKCFFDEIRFGSNWSAVVPLAGEAPLPPDAPGGTLAQVASSSSILVSWQDNSSNETGFKVERSANGETGWALIATPAANSTSITDTGLTPGSSYFYRVKATNEVGDSAPGVSAFAITWTLIEQWTEDNELGDLTADSDGDGSSDLLEYALGGDPHAQDPAHMPTLGEATVGEATHLTLTFDRIADPNVVYEVWASTDLIDWGTTPVWSSSGVQNTPGEVTVTDSAAVGDHPRRFLRLRATYP